MTDLSTEQTLELALDHHRGGRFAEAEGLYRAVIAREPENADALNLLGVLAAQGGRPDIAVELINLAIAINPGMAEYHNNLGSVLESMGQLAEAVVPFEAAIKLQPGFFEPYFNLGNVFSKQGNFDAAIVAYRRALQLDDANPEAHHNLAYALHRGGKNLSAVIAYSKAIELKNDYSEAYYNLGDVLMEMGRFDEARSACEMAVRHGPGDAKAHYQLGNVLVAQGRLDESAAAYSKAIELLPTFGEAYSNLGNVLSIKGKSDQAIDAFRTAIQHMPQPADAHTNLAMALLLDGDFARGLPEYEWRSQTKDAISTRRQFSQPQWHGEELGGKTILLHAEYGFGDTIQFIRYAPLVARRGGRVIVECPQELARLLQSVEGVAEIVVTESPPPFDVQCPMLSLPLAFGTRLESIPADVPYLHADETIAESWGERLDASDGRFRVGLAWAGHPRHNNDRRRSIALAALTPLSAAAGVTFYSLQKSPEGRQISDSPPAFDLIDLTAELSDFAQTAAFLSHLDLVISVDTAVAHLAGALGKQVWLLLPFNSDWRWLRDRDDSPWYPTMRLFRQKSAGEWGEVIERVAGALSNAAHTE